MTFKTVNTGGGCMADIITLADGSVVVCNDEYVGAYENEDAFWNGDEMSAMFGGYIPYCETTLDALQEYRAGLIAEMPDDDYARNWDRWDELDAIEQAIAIVEGADHA